MASPLAGHTNSYHTYSFEEALAGIAEAGYRGVELSAVPGWTEHVDLDGPKDDVRARLDHYGLEAVSLSSHSDLTTADGLAHGIKGVNWAAEFGLPIVNTAIGGHWSENEDESAFMGNIEALADAAKAAGVVVALEIHGDIMASGATTRPLMERIGREEIKVNYDTANCEFYGDVAAVDDIADDRALPGPLSPQGQDRRRQGLELPGAGRGPHRFRGGAEGVRGRGLHRPVRGRDRVRGRALAAARRGDARDGERVPAPVVAGALVTVSRAGQGPPLRTA